MLITKKKEKKKKEKKKREVKGKLIASYSALGTSVSWAYYRYLSAVIVNQK
jgi:hypothetical protein